MLPMIDKQYRPEVLHAGDARFDDMVSGPAMRRGPK
jgi:hypothetical protein